MPNRHSRTEYARPDTLPAKTGEVTLPLRRFKSEIMKMTVIHISNLISPVSTPCDARSLMGNVNRAIA
jgi:hypothetical protein